MFDRLAETIKETGGATVDPLTLQPVEHGVCCGGRAPAYRFPVEQLDGAHIRKAVAKYATICTPGAQAVGFWTEAGEVWAEVSDVFKSRRDAVAAGIQRGEIAVYDIDAAEEIRLRAA